MTPEIFTVICDRIANGESLRSICRDDGMPGRTTVLRYLEEKPDARGQYARAKEAQADDHFDQVVEIAGNVQNGLIPAAEARAAIDALKWTAGKMRPKVYGDKLAIGGADDLPPIEHKVTPDAAFAEFARLLGGNAPASAGSVDGAGEVEGEREA